MGTNSTDICCRDVAEQKLKILASIEGLFDHEASLLNENYHCVPAFLNFIRDKCSWVLSSKGISSPVKVTTCVENNIKSPSSGIKSDDVAKVLPGNLNFNRNINSLDSKLGRRQSPGTPVNRSYDVSIETSPETSSGIFINRKFDHPKTPKSDRTVQKFSLGCESYDRKRDSKKYHRLQGEKPVVRSAESSPAPDINNVDLFPPVGSDGSVKSCRRITPTPVCPQKVDTPRFSRVLSTVPANRVWKNAVFSDTPLQDEKDPKLKSEREMLKKTRSAFVKHCPSEPRVSPPDIQPSQVENDAVPVHPVLCKVHNSEKLDKVVDAYCYCLEYGLVPNIGGEIYFMFQILTSVGKLEEEESDGKSIFGTVHNCVYFAVSVLNHQKNLLNILDHSTLKTFAEIPYLADFSEEVFHYVTTICDGRSIKEVPKAVPVPQVFFQADTDSRENFPNDSSFHSFRKQRDLFYELLRDWQDHNTFDSQFQHQFSKKVQYLIGIGTQTINYVHLARLLQSQLIASCLGTPESFESYSGALGDIKRSFPDRVEKLEGRFLSPLKAGGTGPASFYGIQTFFCEFIHAASSVALNQHLLDIIACKILELNDHEFLHCAAESQNQDEILNEYSSVLNTLRLLAKFFGYLLFIPYKTTDVMPQLLVAYQLKLRKCTKPLLDVGNILRKALVKRTLVLTIPWVVDYLGMMDPVAVCLDYNQEIFSILVEIYQGKFKTQISDGNLIFLKLVIGWLFDSRNFPQELIYSADSGGKYIETNSVNPRENIDSLLKIHGQLIYSCSPHLVELRFLLDDYVSGIKTAREVRKIKPIPTSPIALPGFSDQLLEQQLEENFFLLHSRSLKKTVEFVADRIASRIIQRIKKEVQAMKLVAVLAAFKDPELPVDKKTKENREVIAKIVDQETNILCDKAKQMARLLTEKQCLPEIENVIPLLISEDTKESVVKTCCQISARQAISKVMQWSELNITPEYIKPDIKSKVEHSLKSGSSAEPFVDSVPGQSSHNVPSEALSSLRNISVSIHMGKQDISVHQILQLLNSIESACREEKEIGVLKVVIILTVDIMLSLIARLPWLCSDEIISVFVAFWTSSNLLSPEEILCSRSIHFLYENGDSNLSWYLFRSLLEHLLEQGLFTSEQLQNCVSNVPLTNWNLLSQEQFTACVQGVLENYISKSNCTESHTSVDNDKDEKQP